MRQWNFPVILQQQQNQSACSDKCSPFTCRCKVCQTHFLSSNCLDRHIKQSHEMKEFKCQHMFCVESFSTQKILDEHFAANHSRKECPHCKKMILETYLTQHIRDRHDVEKRGVVCELCGKVSLNKQMHKAHYQTAHNDSEQLQCDICGRWYGILKLPHIMNLISKYICEYGAYLYVFFRYKNKDSMRAHLK